MSVSPLLGNPKPQFFISGIPAVNYRLFFYAASTSTKQDTYTNSTATVANTNPIVLDAEGYPTGNVMIYGTDNVGYKVVLAPPGSDDPPTSPLWTIDKVYPGSTVNGEWINPIGALRASATSFTVTGDYTNTFYPNSEPGLPIYCTGGADRYATVVSATYSAPSTTVNVENVEDATGASSTLHASMDTVYIEVAGMLARNLASQSDTTKGDALIGGKRTEPNVSGFTLHTYNQNRIKNIKTDYGAIGDGSTDDTTAIQNAIDDAIVGDIIYFPPSATPYSAEGIQLKGNITLLAHGDRFTDVIKGRGSSDVFLTGTYPGGNTANNRDIHLIGLTVNGNGYRAIQWYTAYNGYWENCYFYTTGINAVDVRYSPRLTITNSCRFATTGAFTALSLYDNCNAVTINQPIITGGSSGKAITIDLCAVVKLNQPIIESSKSGIEICCDTTNIGNCHSITIDNPYLENSETPIILGTKSAVIGGYINQPYIGNTAPSTNDYFIRIGAVVGMKILGIEGSCDSGNSTNVIDFYDKNDAATTVLPIGCEIDIGYVVDAGANYSVANLSNANYAADVFAKNKIFIHNTATSLESDYDNYRSHGELREYITEVFTCNSAVSAYTFIPSDENFFIEKVEIINAIGTLDGTLKVGDTTSAVDFLSFDMSTASVSGGYQNISSSLSKGRSRNGEPGTVSMVAGSQTGTYQVRIRYRGKAI